MEQMCNHYMYVCVCVCVCVCVGVGECACALYSGSLVRQAGPSKLGSAASTDDEVDPRLKNFEPRMIELIISEVLT